MYCIGGSMQDFFDYIKEVSDTIPEGYTKQGLDVYRYLVYLGVDQMLEDAFPQVREIISEEDWKLLLKNFIKDFKFTSPYYSNLDEDFKTYLKLNS